MNNFSKLSNDEYEKICYAIPHKYVVNYFQKNPKEFSKLRPGFRATTIQSKDAIKLLVAYRERGFISSFIEKVVNDWLKDIQSVVQNYQNNGESEITSYIHTLYQSFFSDNVSAYFKLIDKNYSSEQLELMSKLILLLKSTDEKQQELESAVNQLKDELNNLEQKASKKERQIAKGNQQIEELTAKLDELITIKDQYQNLLDSFNQASKENESFKLQIENAEKEILSLKSKIEKLEKDKKDLEISIRSQIEEEKKVEALCVDSSIPLMPKSMDEFKEYLSYNLESIGVSNDPLPIKILLTSYLSSILFQGKPLICNKCFADTFAKCISNTLIGGTPVRTISFTIDIDEKCICKAINDSGRIVVLDNFLGNFNETVLISILEKFKSKILILTVSYEKTLYYLPKEILTLCNYINLVYIPSFQKQIDPDEDPSTIEEEYTQCTSCSKNRHQDIIQKIALELGYSRLLSEKVSEVVCDDTSACATLAFNIIPYMSEVLSKNAFNVSEALQRYTSRSPYKKLFKDWFMV